MISLAISWIPQGLTRFYECKLIKSIKNTLISASAKGEVKIKTKSETITCNSAKYDHKTDIITLIGKVIIKKDKSVLTGETGYVNLKTRKSKIESSKSQRVKGIFKPVTK